MTASQLRTTVLSVLAFFFIAGLVIFAVGARLWFWGHQSMTWPHVSGRLASVAFLGSTGRGNRILVAYDYVVSGQSYHGDRIRFGFIASSEIQQLAQMRNGDSVEVSYDSQDASRSVLFPGTVGTHIPIIIGVVVIGFIASVGFAVLRNPPWKVSDSEQAA
jgi:hypothetical protein